VEAESGKAFFRPAQFAYDVLWNDITNGVVNVTITQAPTTREKKNVDRLLSTGVNLDGEFRVTSALQFAGGYQFAHAVVSSYTPNAAIAGLSTSLVGNWTPEVPHSNSHYRRGTSIPRS